MSSEIVLLVNMFKRKCGTSCTKDCASGPGRTGRSRSAWSCDEVEESEVEKKTCQP